MNKVFLMGRLTKDPEIAQAGDKLVARYSIAVDRKYKDQSGNYPTDFFNLTSFGKTAEFVEKFLKKGTKVVIEGELRNNNYEKDGKTVYQDQIIANGVEFAESKGSGNGSSKKSAEPAPTAADDGGFEAIGEDEELPFN